MVLFGSFGALSQISALNPPPVTPAGRHRRGVGALSKDGDAANRRRHQEVLNGQRGGFTLRTVTLVGAAAW